MMQYESIEFEDVKTEFRGKWYRDTESYFYFDADPRWIMKAKFKEVRNKFKKGEWLFIQGQTDSK